MSDDPSFKRMLEIRQALGASSTAKFEAYLQCVDQDSRMRGLLLFHGASTGRWTAKRVQLQNIPSRALYLHGSEVDTANEAANLGMAGDLYDKHTLRAAQSCIRSMVVAAPGNVFYCADYSAIEGRLLAWLAGEEHIVEAYRNGKRLYCMAAQGIYGVSYDVIMAGRKTDPDCMRMDAVGKVADLACGYQGSVGAFRKMERSQGMHLDLTDEEIKAKIVKGFRDSRPMTVRLWRGLEEACLEAVEHPGTVTSYRGIRFMVTGKFLMMRLLSGRRLYYYGPEVKPQLMPWLDQNNCEVWKDCVSVWGVDSETHQWCESFLYGGALTANAVSGMARDIMCGGLIRLDAAGYYMVLTVHDEVLCEVIAGFGSLPEFIGLMTSGESWTSGLPITAAGWTGVRLKKE